MNVEQKGSVRSRARTHAALGDPVRLGIVDVLRDSDASPSELTRLLDVPSNLLAHHLNILEAADLVVRKRSDGDARRTYLRLRTEALDSLWNATWPQPERVVFVCTANSARSQLAAALWRRASALPTASAGTHPADRIAPGVREAARRRRIPLRVLRPTAFPSVVRPGDLVVTVCDNAHEELGGLDQLHWSVPDPVPIGTATAYDAVLDDLGDRVSGLAARLT